MITLQYRKRHVTTPRNLYNIIKKIKTRARKIINHIFIMKKIYISLINRTHSKRIILKKI